MIDGGPLAVGIDCRSIRRGPAGIATYVEHLLQEIPWLERLDAQSPSNNFLWNQLRPPWAQRRRRWRVYHAPSYTAPLWNLSKVVLMVADVSYLLDEDWYPYPKDPLRRWYYRASLRKADRIIVPSDFTRSELTRLFPELAPRIRRIYLGVSEVFRRESEMGERVRRELNLPSRFVLHVGDIHPRRNLGELEAACRQVDLPLVLVGKVLQGGEPFAGHPLLRTGLTRRQLVGVYNAATLLGYPSSYEGFGLPLVEAMACGLPVVASDRSCIPEICGDAAILVAPKAEGLAEGLSRMLEAPQPWIERGLARAALFSWKETARQTLEVYRELA